MTVVVDFVIARNPDADSTLPYVVRLPLRSGTVLLKTRELWPRASKVYCHPTTVWPDEPEIVETTPIRSIERRGVSIDLVLDRARENRSQFIFTKGRGRDMVFWQSARTAKQARPSVRTPTARAAGQVLDIIVDTRERYAWKFGQQQASTHAEALAVGDYAVREPQTDTLIAVVERKSLGDLVSTITGGKLWTLLAALADQPHSAVVIEDRYSAVFKLEHQRPLGIVEAIAEAGVRYPRVPIVFAESRQLAQEWTYRFFGAAVQHRLDDDAGRRRLAAATVEPAPPVTTADIRAWAIETGHEVAAKGRLRPDVVAAYHAAHPH